MRRKSRLSTYQTKKNKKTIILSVVGIIVILFIMYKFGIEALINFSLFLTGNNSSKDTTSQQKSSYISPPTLNPLLSATNSAQIIITGSSEKDRTIVLYINKKEQANIETNENGGFEFTENLSKGDNLIQVKAKKDKDESDFSNFYTVTFQNTPPKLDLTGPSDGDSFHREDKSVEVKGQTDAGITVTVNGFVAVIDDNNNFSYVLPIHDGDNQINVIAVDDAGNKSEKTIKVNYSQ